MGFHRFVDIERCQALHVKAGQPHGAYDSDAEGVLRVFEGVVDGYSFAVWCLEAGFHHLPMRNDIKAPFFEVADLVLRLADDDLDDRAFHPLRLRSQLIEFLADAFPCRRDRLLRPALFP